MGPAKRSSQGGMASLDRFQALLNSRPVDKVPLYHFMLGFCARNVGFPMASMYKDPEKSFQAQLQTFEQYGSRSHLVEIV